ncbi:MAG TPA: aquaporin [Chitinophagaceae bacterium]|nr:aquaporin [Chitinophagaceae bacterium]
MPRYITEFIGTFFLVLVIALTGDPLVIGAVLMVMVFAGGHISGAHYNPAVTLALLIRKKISAGETLVYIGSQLAGALAAALVFSLFEEPAVAATQVLDTPKALLAEVFGTFALAYVVLNVATARGNAGNSFYGLAIGFTVFAMASAFGSYSGGAFNPAVAVGASVLKVFAWKNFWIYLVGCFGGAAIAAVAFLFLNREDKPVPPLPREN